MTDAPIDIVLDANGEILHPEILRFLPESDIAELIEDGTLDPEDLAKFDIRQPSNGDPQGE